jgi:hypothetical protein
MASKTDNHPSVPVNTLDNLNGNQQQQQQHQQQGEFLNVKVGNPWDTNAQFKTRDNSPSRRKSTAQCWEFVKRLSEDHPKSVEFTHVCVLEHCTDRFMKLFKPKDKAKHPHPPPSNSISLIFSTHSSIFIYLHIYSIEKLIH